MSGEYVRKFPLIAIEGVDGCGKGTQTHRLSTLLSDRHGLNSTVTSVLPGGDENVAYLRKFLLSGEPASRMAEALVYTAAIYEVCYNLSKCEIDLAILDRSIYSLAAYQVYGREARDEGFGVDNFVRFIGMSPYFDTILRPDHVIVLDIPYNVQEERMKARGRMDHFEKMPKEFHDRVRNYYRELGNRSNFTIVSGLGDVDSVTENIYNALKLKAPQLFK